MEPTESLSLTLYTPAKAEEILAALGNLEVLIENLGGRLLERSGTKVRAEVPLRIGVFAGRMPVRLDLSSSVDMNRRVAEIRAEGPGLSLLARIRASVSLFYVSTVVIDVSCFPAMNRLCRPLARLFADAVTNIAKSPPRVIAAERAPRAVEQRAAEAAAQPVQATRPRRAPPKLDEQYVATTLATSSLIASREFKAGWSLPDIIDFARRSARQGQDYFLLSIRAGENTMYLLITSDGEVLEALLAGKGEMSKIDGRDVGRFVSEKGLNALNARASLWAAP
ncbi:MAG: hypothetical protein ABWK00_00060 [Desulfurococcaceae archaeon]